MAIRKIVTGEDEILRKVCKPVEKFDERLWQLLDDMRETLAESNGVGLAAPQVGNIRRVALVDTGEEILELINPEILSSDGSQRDVEGCLSYPGQWGYVTRAMNCKLKAQDRNGNWYERDLSGLSCRCALHETDHLNGKIFIDLIEEPVEADDEE